MMGDVRLLLTIVGLGLLSACGNPSHGRAGTDPNNPAPLPIHSVTSSVMLNETPLATVTSRMVDTTAAFSAGKLIALTFDDGPRPDLLFGTNGSHPAPCPADILAKTGVKAPIVFVGGRC